MELNKRLQFLRKHKNLTQQEVGDKFFVSRQAVQKWESGETAPDITKLYDLSLYYGVSLDSLLDVSLTEEQFKNILLNKSHKDDLTIQEIVNILKRPTKMDVVITTVMIISTAIVLALIHLIGVVLVFLTLMLLIALTISGPYFLVNAFVNINDGINTFLVNIGLSSLTIGLLLFGFERIRNIVNLYIKYVKKVANRLRLYIKLIKGIQDEK